MGGWLWVGGRFTVSSLFVSRIDVAESHCCETVQRYNQIRQTLCLP